MTLKWKIAQKIEARWWRNYLKDKDESEYYTWKKTYWLSFLREISFPLPYYRCNILDAGCGPAGIFTILYDHEVVALDPLFDQYKELPQFKTEEYQHIQFLNGTIEEMGLANSFDIVFCLNAINHVHNIPVALSNLFHHMEIGGMLILSTDAHNSNFLKKVFQTIPGDVLHPHQYDIEEYKQFVIDAGFVIRGTRRMKSDKIFSYWVIKAMKPKRPV